ncbi:rhomboid family protein [Cordyceps fumosorosea ARSEF 2679]|uniref:Rhomboid family protein n=1 Tax=Cordyceps fumosorosea (strain ARSEF 2679) TaxID=1081104 RepID=A0A168E786_CORFA|nr:rhomboid family protein [Cordyceps fumosorosea ARSEF 2679]OAA73456.1 rhomboid family protein [Cordyceps fumosorosea ARSEF 2679]
MNIFLCSRARPLATGAAAAVREATKNLRHSPTLGLARPTSRWISCAGRKDLRPRYCGYMVAWCQTPAIAQPHSRRRTLFSHHGIRDYEQLPSEYQDKTGLPFRSKELSEAEVQRIFGADMKTEPGNYLLRVLHGRRVAGTLDDPMYAVNTRQFTDEQVDRALAYLRKVAPVEEIRNAGLRAEDELAVIEKQMGKTARAAAEVRPNDDKAETEREVPYVQDPVYGHSVFDQIRATNRAKQKARDVAKEKERLEREEREGIVSGTLEELDQGSRGPQTRAITNPKIQAYYEAAQSDLSEPPEMSAWARILPSAVVTALVLGVMAAIGIVYEEPAQRYRLFPEISTAQATVAALVGVNVLVYLAWKVPPLWKHLNKYFIVSVATPRPLAMFAAIFSHQSLGHLLANMVPLMVIGPALHAELGGRADFLTLFLACGSLGFVGSVATYALRGMLGTTTMGGSGATLGLCAAYFWAHRSDGFRFLGLPEGGVHGIVFLAALLGLQLAGVGRALERKIDLASHLAGFAAGVAGVEAVRRRTAMRSRATEGRDGRSVIEVMYWLKPALQAQMDRTSTTRQAAEKEQAKRLEKK